MQPVACYPSHPKAINLSWSSDVSKISSLILVRMMLSMLLKRVNKGFTVNRQFLFTVLSQQVNGGREG
jgi:hypothetical protein